MKSLIYDRFVTYLEAHLSEYRFVHSLGVSKCAKELAIKLGEDAHKAELAGLIHDITKEKSRQEQEELLKRGNISLTETEKISPKLWHAITAPVFLRDEFGITDEGILSAVRYHTTGRADMSPLEKSVYLADFISADRVYPDVDEVRRLSEISVDEAILYTEAYTVRTLSSAGRPIHPDSLACYNQLICKLRYSESN